MDYFQNLQNSIFGGEKTGTMDFSQPSLYGTCHTMIPSSLGPDELVVSAAAIAFNPVFWK
jgi:hypothetical protein